MLDSEPELTNMLQYPGANDFPVTVYFYVDQEAYKTAAQRVQTAKTPSSQSEQPLIGRHRPDY